MSKDEWSDVPTLSVALKAKIEEARVSQREAAQRIGCDYDQLNKWLAGAVPNDHFPGLARFLEVDIFRLGAYVLRQTQERTAARRRR